jgi:hypothetical protein
MMPKPDEVVPFYRIDPNSNQPGSSPVTVGETPTIADHLG